MFANYFEAQRQLYILFGMSDLSLMAYSYDSVIWNAESFEIERYKYNISESLRPLVTLDENLLGSSTPLYVRRISFASPGFTDLVGAAQVIGHLKDFLVEILNYRNNAERREADLSKARAEAALTWVQSAKVWSEVVAMRLAQLKGLGFRDDQLQKVARDAYFHQQTLESLARSGRFHDTELLSVDDV